MRLTRRQFAARSIALAVSASIPGCIGVSTRTPGSEMRPRNGLDNYTIETMKRMKVAADSVQNKKGTSPDL